MWNQGVRRTNKNIFRSDPTHSWLISSFIELDSDYKGPELFSNTIQSGDKLYAMIFKPNRMEPGKKYPVVLNVYGGPEVQLVSNTFKV